MKTQSYGWAPSRNVRRPKRGFANDSWPDGQTASRRSGSRSATNKRHVWWCNMLKSTRVTVKWQRTSKEKMFPSVGRSGGFGFSCWTDEAAAGLQIEVGRPPARPCLQESLRWRSEEPGGRSVTGPLASAFTKLAAETRRRVSHQLPPAGVAAKRKAAAALTERLREKYDKDFCFSLQPGAIDRR